MKVLRTKIPSLHYDVRFFDQISEERFLKDYWRKKPLLIRQGVKWLKTLHSKKEIFDRASDQAMTSRIIRQLPKRSPPWDLKHGPFLRSDFDRAPPSHWTVLVQELDRVDDRLAAMRQGFALGSQLFFDDIMVSYAADGGGVGPHFDHYDVFLVQGAGRRHWQLSRKRYNDEHLIENSPIKVLKDFHSVYDWHVDAGDVIYVPPGVAHYGRSEGESICYSVGFKVPRWSEFFAHAYEYFVDQNFGDQPLCEIDLEIKSATELSLLGSRSLAQLCADAKRSGPMWAGLFASSTRGSTTAKAARTAQWQGLSKDPQKYVVYLSGADVIVPMDRTLSARYWINGVECTIDKADCKILKYLAEDRCLRFGSLKLKAAQVDQLFARLQQSYGLHLRFAKMVEGGSL